MFITIINLTAGPVSLPGPLPRLNGSTNIQEVVTTEIGPEEFDRIKDELGSLVTNNVIRTLIEPCGSFLGNYKFDDHNKTILYGSTVIAAPGAGGLDQLVKITAADNISDFLNSKLQAGNNVTLSVENPGGNEKLKISAAMPATHATTHENGGSDEINVGGLSGVLADPQVPITHATTHKSGGGDEVAVAVAGANAIPKANPTGTLNGGWIDDTSHGNRSGGSLHSIVVAGGANGFMLGTDKTKLDGVATGATNTPLSSTAPVNVTRVAANSGSATSAARQDHKHDISTAAPTQGIGGSNSAGTASTLISSDHDHTIHETGGPTDLTIGAIPNNQALVRSGVAIVGKSRVKEVFTVGADYSANYGDFRVRPVAGTGANRFSFSVPQDFASLVSLELIGIPQANGAGVNIDLDSDYGAVGQAYNTHSESETTLTYNFTQDQFFALNIATVFSALAAGDFCGVYVNHLAIGTTINYIGIRLRYNPT